MKWFSTIFIILFTGLVLIQSCSIEKRRHLSGWHITSKKLKKNNSEDSASKSIEAQKEITEDVQNSVALELSEAAIGEVLVKDSKPVKNATTDFPVTSTDFKRKEKAPESIQESTFDLNVESDQMKNEEVEKEKSEPWFLGVLGGFLGFLLGIVTLPILFVICFLLFSGDNDEFEELIQESSKDSPFSSGFKRTFNAIIYYGLSVLLILLMIAIFIAIVIGLYQLYGVIGVFLGIIVLLLLFLLIAFLLDGFLSFILPGY